MGWFRPVLGFSFSQAEQEGKFKLESMENWEIGRLRNREEIGIFKKKKSAVVKIVELTHICTIYMCLYPFINKEYFGLGSCNFNNVQTSIYEYDNWLKFK